MVEVINHISVVEKIIVIDIVPRDIKPVEGMPYFMCILDDTIIFKEAGRKTNINDPPTECGL
jgi:hypothetical protein